MLSFLWILGFAGLLVYMARLAAKARQKPNEIVPRLPAVCVALCVSLLGASSAYVWGIDIAERGMARILDGAEDQRSPARARLFLRNVQLLIEDQDASGVHQGRLGYSPDAALHLPRAYGLDESKRGWDLLELRSEGPQGISVSAIDLPESSATRIRVYSRRRGDSILLPHEVAQQATRFAGRGKNRCAPEARDADHAELDGPGAVYAILCIGRNPKAALVLERDLSSQLRKDEGVPIRVAPLVWRGGRFHPHHVQISSGSLVQIGAMADALPGITLWEVPAPRGRAELFYPPNNVLASCDEWLRNQERGGSGFVTTETLNNDASSVGDDPICVLPFTPPFGLEVRRLLPDLPSIAARSFWSAGLIVTPALLLLLLLCSQRRSKITRQRLLQATALGWLSSFLAAIAVWRLLWSHRIDMLRDYEAIGARVVQNQLVLVLAGAALAATAFGLWNLRGSTKRRLLTGSALWITWLAVSGYALRGDFANISVGSRLIFQVGISWLVGSAVVWVPASSRLLLRLSENRDWQISTAALFALGLVALLARDLAPRAVALKLGIAWMLVLLFYSALRLSVDTPVRMLVTFVVGLLAAAMCVAFDPGVTTAIVGPGLLLAVLFAAHDARYGEDSARKMSAFARHHAPVVIAQIALTGATGLAVLVWAVVGLGSASSGESDAALSRTLTFGAIHLLAFFALLFVPAAVITLKRRGPVAALPWILAGLTLAGAWLARGPILDRALGSGTQAANRVAIVVDPGYALLRSETKFLSGITAWRETIVPGDAPDLMEGQGYFGAQLIDPGVLLSVENDYFPILLTREGGLAGLLSMALLLAVLITGFWFVAGSRFRHGSGPQRRRSLVSIVLGFLIVYQPLASLGVLPLTGIAWPGLGLDSPTDFWLLVILSLWILVWSPAANDEQELDELDRDVRSSRLFRHVRIGSSVIAGVVALASLLVVTRAAAFAMRRPNPIDESGKAVAPFDALESALAYAYQLQCPWDEKTSASPEELVPSDLLADPTDTGSQRFHNELRAKWQHERADAVSLVESFLRSPEHQCRGQKDVWSAKPWGENQAECRLHFKSGWPEIQLTLRKTSTDQITAHCETQVRTSILKRLRFPAKRPYQDARIRLVSRAMGDAARDHGELISGQLSVRLRPGAGAADVSTARSGLYQADIVQIAPHLVLEVRDDGVVLRKVASTTSSPNREDDETVLFVPEKNAAQIQVLEASDSQWRMLPPDANEVRLTRMALLVVGGPRSRNLWLFRPAASTVSSEAKRADPLLADDITTVRGERRRHYLYGGLVPELGWVNPYQKRMSLGLDGWVNVAMTEYETNGAENRLDTWLDGDQERNYCGTLSPEAPGDPLKRVCSPSPLDGVLECRVSIQPELSIRLRHLSELISLAPEEYAGKSKSLNSPLRTNVVVVRGDTGEIVAQNEFVVGRASSAYAPTSPELEQHLIRLREDRDPKTGTKLPRSQRGESSAEKVEWNHSVAVGSLLKPLLGRALERSDPEFARSLLMTGNKVAGARCARGVHAILGHCPPTDTLWNYGQQVDISTYISQSVNWFQAAVGFIGTAVPGGSWGFGKQEAVEEPEFLSRNLGDHKPNEALWTEHRGKRVVHPGKKIHIPTLKETPFWKNLESIIGRPLCGLGNKHDCVQQAARKDLCAARALPIRAPSSDLRHLVATGPASFDFYAPLAVKKRKADLVHTREYLQFLRGSGLHPFGSLLQLVDAFNRVVFAPQDQRLAASWFPVEASGLQPALDCKLGSGENTVAGGLCEVLTSGTAKALKPLLSDPRIVLYGAKTGTIDSLGDIAEDKEACKHFQSGHTVPDSKPEPEEQPYWLDCQKKARPEINDSLLVISFGVYSPDGVVPLTLGLRFQRGGVGLATRVARHYVDAITEYFAP